MLGDCDTLFERDGWTDASIFARSVEAVDVIFHAVRLLVKRSHEIGDRSAENDSKIVHWEDTF